MDTLEVASGPTASYGSEVKQNTDFLNAGETIAAYGESEGPIVDNSSDLYIGLSSGTFRIVADGATEIGSYELFIETSSDNSVWPSDMLGFKITHLVKVAEINIVTTTSEDQSYATNFEVI